MDLMEQLQEGVRKEQIKQPFTMQDFKEWVETYNITKPSGRPYSKNSIYSFLSNSSKKNEDSSNFNRKELNSRINADNKQEYWFDDLFVYEEDMYMI